MAWSSTSQETKTDKNGRARAPAGLWNAMKARGREFIGVAITLNRNPQDPKERAIYGNRNDFNSMTPENAMKWISTEPTRNNLYVS